MQLQGRPWGCISFSVVAAPFALGLEASEADAQEQSAHIAGRFALWTLEEIAERAK